MVFSSFVPTGAGFEAHVAVGLSQRQWMPASTGMKLGWRHISLYHTHALLRDFAKLLAALSIFAEQGHPWLNSSCTWKTGRPY